MRSRVDGSGGSRLVQVMGVVVELDSFSFEEIRTARAPRQIAIIYLRDRHSEKCALRN